MFDNIDKIAPIEFKEEELESCSVKYTTIDGNLVIQVFPLEVFPEFPGARVAKAIEDTLGESSLRKFYIEEITSELIEGGQSVYIKGDDLGTDVVISIMFPTFFQHLDATMQDV